MKLVRLLVFGLMFVVSGVALMVILLIKAPGQDQTKERFVINIGTSEEKIIDGLYQKGFIRNKSIFSAILTSKGWHGKIQPGSYQISRSMNAYDLAKILVSEPYQRWVIILPGKRKEQTALVLRQTFNWSEDKVKQFLDTAEEGYLYPDTYLINTDYSPAEVYQKIKNNFNDKFDAKLQTDLLAQNIRNDTAIKIASLIERESGGAEDKPIIAGILWNRLNKGMKLEIDATIQYGLVSRKLSQITNNQLLITGIDWWPKIIPDDIKNLVSPYNTYLTEGLPPGPICSPTVESIKAVAYPSETDTLYYLHSPDKKIHTAKTYAEHLQNIEEFLR